MADDLRALAVHLFDLHRRVARILQGGDIGQLTDDYYRPHPGGPLEGYMQAIDDLGRRFSVGDGRFYPTDGEEPHPHG